MNKIREAMEPLEPLEAAGAAEYPACINDYFAFYELDIENDDDKGDDVEHVFGWFESGGERLAGHIFRPAEYKATVFAVHGYFDHCGQLSHLIKYLVSNGYAVAAFDLPGLGLSGGQRGAIDDFSQYRHALLDFADKVGPQVNAPYHFIGHSTGAVAILDYLLTNENTVFDRIVLAAPLVHCAAWEQTKMAYKEKIPFVKSVPRKFRKNSSDAGFLDFVKNQDWLQTRTIPLKWIRALHEWNDKIADLPMRTAKVKVVQGTRDATIEWEYNIEFIREKFSNVDVSLLENCRHELFNESVNICKEVFLQISKYLEDGNE